MQNITEFYFESIVKPDKIDLAGKLILAFLPYTCTKCIRQHIIVDTFLRTNICATFLNVSLLPC